MTRTAHRTAPLVACVLLAAGGIALAAPASAEVANPHAACPGLALSDHASPQGGSMYGGPGTIAATVAGLRSALELLGFDNTGQVMSRWAKAHPGSHDPGCEQAVLDILATP
jgi:hypothetical protein